MTIPEARRLLLNLAATLDPVSAAEIARIVKEGLYRRKGVRPTRPKNKRLTKILRAQIRSLHKAHPDLSELEIANMVGTNPGRVSESIIGRRI